MTADEQCQEQVLIRDTYRYTGRGSGFAMHYTERRCQRLVKDGQQFCWQHRKIGGYISRDEAERIVLDMMTPAEPGREGE